jgi:hypothetical protein
MQLPSRSPCPSPSAESSAFAHSRSLQGSPTLLSACPLVRAHSLDMFRGLKACNLHISWTPKVHRGKMVPGRKRWSRSCSTGCSVFCSGAAQRPPGGVHIHSKLPCCSFCACTNSSGDRAVSQPSEVSFDRRFAGQAVH